MSYETLAVQCELGRSNVAPLAVTRDVARRVGAAVTGLAAAQPIQALVMAEGFYSGDLVREDSDGIEQEAEAARVEFESEMHGQILGLDWNMAVTRAPLSDHIAGQIAASDLLVAGIDQSKGDLLNTTRRVDIGDLILRAGRPTLVVPLTVQRFDFNCALIAWKDCREARRAIADALPLLKHMGEVVIAEIAPLSRQAAAKADLARMVTWLARHGIEARAHFALSGGSDSDHLLALAGELGADLTIAGAYGHSRIREWVLGGVTRDLLHHSRHCLLLSH